MAMQGVDPFEEGQLAAARGHERSANPYAPTAIESDQWFAGFDSFAGADEAGRATDA